MSEVSNTIINPSRNYINLSRNVYNFINPPVIDFAPTNDPDAPVGLSDRSQVIGGFNLLNPSAYVAVAGRLDRKGLFVFDGHQVYKAKQVFADICAWNPLLYYLDGPAVFSKFAQGKLGRCHITNSLAHPQQYLRFGLFITFLQQFLHFIQSRLFSGTRTTTQLSCDAIPPTALSVLLLLA
jgi:hypothetical protein